MDDKKITAIAVGLEGVRKSMENLNGVLSGGPASYYYERIIEYYEGCMAAGKFKVGQRVKLREDYTDGASGWAHCRHFLVKDSPGTVKAMDYYKGKYCYDIEFDNETWIDTKGEKRPVDRKHVFRFAQDALKKLKD